jgi:hypothetical protein
MALTLAETRAVEAALPPLGREISDAIGLAGAVRLMREMRGERVFFPAGHSPTVDRLVDILGDQRARALLDRFRLDHVEVPKAVSLVHEMRAATARRLAARLYAEGHPKPVGATAVAVGLTSRRTRALLAGPATNVPAVPVECLDDPLAWLEAQLDDQPAHQPERLPEPVAA